MKKSEIRERQYLSKTIKRLQKERERLVFKLKQKKLEIEEDTVYRGEAKSDMDHGEKVTIRQAIEEKAAAAERADKRIKKIDKLAKSPYFGRFDFQKKDEEKKRKIYLGIYDFYDFEKGRPLIYDWRAPVSSVFYNYELGSANYEGPIGPINGEVSLKRQFRIRDGEMEFMLESAVNIMDDFLQKELSRSSDEGMSNIVATIQRNQNSIIRDEHSPNLIIQGTAGSGKTSIALHRIAFLLYRFKETLKSEDILIISPNKVFADYISNVLPELGEESVSEIQMETLAKELLGSEYRFQTFFEQSAELLEKEDVALQERIKAKSSPEFLEVLNRYVEHIKKRLFVADYININGCFVPDWLFEEVFQTNNTLSKKKCVSEITKTIKQKIALEYDYILQSDESAKLKRAVEKMHQGKTLQETYIDIFNWLGKLELFKKCKDGKLEYADVFPMLYLKICLEGKGINIRPVKHLIIDEMQDYTSIQYAVIAKLFKCNKTILGDAKQSVNPYSSSNAEVIKNTFSGSSYVQLNKSYRSTYEIMNFVQKISFNPDLEAMKRYGEEPQTIGLEKDSDEIAQISQICKEMPISGFNTLGIICKTQKQAERISEKLKKAALSIQLLTGESNILKQGIIICTAHMAKGLEFDQVIVPNASAENYSTPMDKSLLYVACTRAMHKLTLTYVSERTKLINN